MTTSSTSANWISTSRAALTPAVTTMSVIGILGVDKHDEEWYQITIGGAQSIAQGGAQTAKIGKIIGPSFARAEVADVVETLIQTYLGLRERDDERFVDVVARVGIDPFKERVYAEAD